MPTHPDLSRIDPQTGLTRLAIVRILVGLTDARLRREESRAAKSRTENAIKPVVKEPA